MGLLGNGEGEGEGDGEGEVGTHVAMYVRIVPLNSSFPCTTSVSLLVV